MRRFTLLAAAVAATSAATALVFSGGATAQPSGLPTLNLTMTGKTISVSGQTVSGAVDVHSTVTGAKEASPTLVRLNDGVTPAQFFAFMKSRAARDANNVSTVGSIVFDATAPKGTSDAQTILQPGNYVALDTARMNPPFPATTFTVTQSSSPAALPKADATVSTIEFGFRGPRTLRNGSLVRLQNKGWLVHMAIAFGVRKPATGRRVMHLLRAGKDSRAQRLSNHSFLGLAGPVGHGAEQQSVLHAKPGWYVLACFMDTQDGREHTQLGMERLIRVR